MTEDSDFFAALFEQTDDGEKPTSKDDEHDLKSAAQSPWVHSSKTPGGVTRPIISKIEAVASDVEQTSSPEEKHRRLEIDDLHYEHLAALEAPSLDLSDQAPEPLFATPRAYVTPAQGVEVPLGAGLKEEDETNPAPEQIPEFAIEDFPSAPAPGEPDTISFGGEIIEEFEWEEDPSRSGDGMISGFSDAFDRALDSLPAPASINPPSPTAPALSPLDLVGESISIDGFSEDSFDLGAGLAEADNEDDPNPFAPPIVQDHAEEKIVLQPLEPAPGPEDFEQEVTVEEKLPTEKVTLEQVAPEQESIEVEPQMDDDEIDSFDEDRDVVSLNEDINAEASFEPNLEDREIAKAHELYTEAVQDLSMKNFQSALVRARMAVAFAPTEKTYKDFLIDLGKVIESQDEST